MCIRSPELQSIQQADLNHFDLFYVLSYARVPDSGTVFNNKLVSQELCMLILWIWPNKCGDCGVESSVVGNCFIYMIIPAYIMREVDF